LAVAVLQNGVISRVRGTGGTLSSDEEEPSCALAIISSGVIDLVFVAGDTANVQEKIVEKSHSTFVAYSLQNIETVCTDALVGSEDLVFAADRQTLLGLIIQFGTRRAVDASCIFGADESGRANAVAFGV
jgi:hypothetical protein